MFKELLYEQLGIGDLDWSAALGGAAMETLALVVSTEVDAGRSLVIEANFRRAPAALARIRAVQVFCTDTREVLNARYRSRERHPGHLDDQRVIDPDEYAPLAVDGSVLRWRIGDDVGALLGAVRAALG